jgi:hypothetical protein
MNATLRDLKRHADTLAPPSFDVGSIIERGDARRRRRRGAAAAAAAVLVVAVIAAGMAFVGPDPRSNQPIDHPTPSVTESPVPAPAPARPLTYADDYKDVWDPEQSPHWLMRSIHYGPQILRPEVDAMHMDLTDDGVALVAEDGGIYFADGSSVEKIGELTIGVSESWSDTGVKSADAGSLLAWFTPAKPDPFLVVFDTHERKAIARISVPNCRRFGCRLTGVVGDRVYWEQSPDEPQRPVHLLMGLDVSGERVFKTDQSVLSEDLRSHPRALVIGDSFADGAVVSIEANFLTKGSSLVLRGVIRETGDGEQIYGSGGFDTTGRRLHLRLPDGYKPAATGYSLFQWLDDDSFAVMAGAVHNDFGWNGFRGYGDILVCNIAHGQCALAVKGPKRDRYRLVPHVDVPN